MAIFPFIILQNKHQKANKALVNHERIHLRQQLELLIIPFYLLYILNYLVNLIRFRNHYLAYFNIRFEREAYANENDLGYLSRRKLFSWFRYHSQMT
ncbi:hypothetical protein BFS30_04930 [Pedobacter steynii]|uniref:DUF4157 domain-containing protein n=1 Tax=Pedobacter steynii TaxID=430522 RepID=A0A1D7QCY8_9SPHI|nr:hypothetical protein [Pedobacter steynii]AOM76556.1 hypothetical protein BFS30_04930 [Pedobacter steynii]